MKKGKKEPEKPIEKEIKKAELVPVTKELKSSYLDYAMSVIVSRALPDIRDGLKPVQRRILWSMWDDGVTVNSKFRKSANIVGSVLGRYHPHGDTAVYDALVRMAQDFSLRYPLINGQGNFGSIDGDSAAAMRYSEARLSKIAEELLKDIEKETVDWQLNYDNTREEPMYLPAKIPNLLLNGQQGIAVGMATSIPPHNLEEVIDASIHLAQNPKTGVEEMLKFIKGPDFPTGGIIYDAENIKTAYQTGKGSVTIRGKVEVEEASKGGDKIVITEIPYQVNKATLVAKIASLVQDKKIEGIKDLRDESDRDGMRISIDLKSDAVPQRIINQLYEYTELQKNFYFNMLALSNGIQPQIFSLKEILEAFLEHRHSVVKKRTEFELRQAEKRAHILEGLSKALRDIDKVISTIKKSKDRESAHKNLVSKFSLSDLQASAILEIRLQTLAALERQKIDDELAEKKKLIADLKLILKSRTKLTNIVIKELEGVKRDFPSPRKTHAIAKALPDFKKEELIPKEDVIISISKDGYIKKVLPNSFRAQKRGGKGLMGSELKEGDFVQELVAANTHDNILFFSSRGKVFQVKCWELPTGTRTSKGKLVSNFLSLSQGESVSAIINYSQEDSQKSTNKDYAIMITRNGIIKKTPISDFANIRRNGIVAINLRKDDVLEWVKFSGGSDEVIIVTENGTGIRFKEKDIRSMGRSASGIKAINLKKNDRVSGFDIIKKKEKNQKTKEFLLTITAEGFAKQTPIKDFRLQKRGGSGLKAAKITPKSGPVIAAKVIDESYEEIIVFSSKGVSLRTKISDIRTAGRATQGVKMMRLDKGDNLIGAVYV